jgi:N-acetyl-anhydromuramyl-L-alanine amidase AmpD
MKSLRLLVLFMTSLLLSACSGLRYVDIVSTNQNSRVNYLVIHATSSNFGDSLRLLSTRNPNPVSAHYLVPYLGDPSYTNSSIQIYRLVDEDRRAWHAGISQWEQESSLNNRSIGIEVVNDFKCSELITHLNAAPAIELECSFPVYPDSQIDSLVLLIKEILERHPGIDPVDIVAHADIAPSRKSDPGPNFPWQKLYEAGIGAWYENDTVAGYLAEFERQLPSIHDAQCALSIYGYPITQSGAQDLQSQFAFRAFQLHYRASDYSGLIDTETLAILYALNEKYRVLNPQSCNRSN